MTVAALSSTDRRLLKQRVDAAARRRLADHEHRFAGYQQCAGCLLNLPADEFSRRSYCRVCEAERLVRYRRDKARAA